MRLRRESLQPLFILDYNNPLYSDDGGFYSAIQTPDNISGFAKLAAAAVQHFNYLDPIWEIYSEPTQSQYWNPVNALAYTSLAMAAINRIRDTVLDATVIAPALGNADNMTENDYLFLEQTFEGGLLNHVDAVSVHPYQQQNPEGTFKEYQLVGDLIKKHSPHRPVPILVSEHGFSDN